MAKPKLDQEFLKENSIEKLVNSFASSAELYSVVLDINGKPLINPVGPAPYLGEFHEMVFNPEFTKLYEEIVNCIADSKQAMYSEIDDGNPDSRFAAAPIFVNGRFYAAWIIYAHTKNQNQKLFKAFDHMANVANVLSDIISKLFIGSAIYDEEEEMKSELDFEKNGREIMSKILKIVSEGDKSNVLEVYENVGTLLDVDYIVYYQVDHNQAGRMKLIDYWARFGKSPEAEASFTWDHDHYDLDLQEKIREEGLIVDKNNMTNKMRVEVFQGNVKAIMVFPVRIAGEYEGRMIFIENSRERIWKKNEIAFAKEVTDMISRDLTIERRIQRSRRGTRILREIFDELPVLLFVRDIENGKVIYTNPALKGKMGYDMTGENSFMMIPNVKEEFEGMDNKTHDIVHHGKEYYKRYIDKLGGIYDVVEYFTRWRDGEKVAVLIMTPEE